MSNLVKWTLVFLGIIITLNVVFFTYMKSHDGPLEIIAGGPFTTGELVRGAEPDWSFLKDRATVEIQLFDPDSSRTLWLVVIDNKLYMASLYMKTGIGKIWKKWPIYAENNNLALLRVDRKIYERKLMRLTKDELPEGITEEFDRKYKSKVTAKAVVKNRVWGYELAPRTP